MAEHGYSKRPSLSATLSTLKSTLSTMDYNSRSFLNCRQHGSDSKSVKTRIPLLLLQPFVRGQNNQRQMYFRTWSRIRSSHPLTHLLASFLTTLFSGVFLWDTTISSFKPIRRWCSSTVGIGSMITCLAVQPKAPCTALKLLFWGTEANSSISG